MAFKANNAYCLAFQSVIFLIYPLPLSVVSKANGSFLFTQSFNAPKFIVMDMMLVQGIDSSAVKSFEKLARDLEKKEIDLVIVHASDPVRKAFEADGLKSSDYENIHYFDYLEHANEWCEDLIAENEARKIEEAKMKGQELRPIFFRPCMPT